MSDDELFGSERIDRLVEGFEFDPDEYGSDLAEAYAKMSRSLAAADRLDEAMSYADRAVDVSRQIGFAESESILPQLASSLAGLGTRLAAVDRVLEAIAVTQEAVDIRRQLAARDPNIYEHRLAMSLVQLSHQLDRVERSTEALSSSLEAVSIFRQLVAAQGENEEVVLRGLATALVLIGYQFRAVEDGGASTASFQEASDLFRQINDLELRQQTLTSLAEAYKYQGKIGDAEDTYRQMLALCEEQGNKMGVADSFEGLGMLAQERGDFESAESYYRQCLPINIKLDDKAKVSTNYHQLGVLAQGTEITPEPHPITGRAWILLSVSETRL